MLPGGPEVLLHHAIENDEVNPFVVEGVGRFAEHLLPLLAQIEIPVVLADHDLQRGLEILEDLGAQFKLLGRSELRQVAPIEDEVGLRVEFVHVVDRAEQPPHETVIDVLLVQVRVRDIGEPKGQFRF